MGYPLMNKPKLNLVIYFVYQAVLIVAAGLIVVVGGMAWGNKLLSENLVVLGVLCVSAVAVETLPIRRTATQYTTLVPIVLLLVFMLTGNAVVVVAVSGLGAFVGYGLLREFPSSLRQRPRRTIQRILFYAAQSVVAAAIAGGLHSLLPDSTPTTFGLNDALTGSASVVSYIVLSWLLVSSQNWLMSALWLDEEPQPTQNLLVFFLTIIAPLITVWFYQTLTAGEGYLLTKLLGREGVKSLVIFVVWPLVLLFFYIIFPYLTKTIESQEMKKGYEQLVRYSEIMLDMAAVAESVATDMKNEFKCDDSIVYSWNAKEGIYELEGGLIGETSAFRQSAETMPDIDWPKEVEPEGNALG
jgi:hypothetical protein